jgi:hypothetical protein
MAPKKTTTDPPELSAEVYDAIKLAHRHNELHALIRLLDDKNLDLRFPKIVADIIAFRNFAKRDSSSSRHRSTSLRLTVTCGSFTKLEIQKTDAFLNCCRLVRSSSRRSNVGQAMSSGAGSRPSKKSGSIARSARGLRTVSWNDGRSNFSERLRYTKITQDIHLEISASSKLSRQAKRVPPTAG